MHKTVLQLGSIRCDAMNAGSGCCAAMHVFCCAQGFEVHVCPGEFEAPLEGAIFFAIDVHVSVGRRTSRVHYSARERLV